MNKKIAFVHFPKGIYSSRLEGMSFVLNSVLALANFGWEVDVYLWEEPSLNYKNLFPANVNILYFNAPKNRVDSLLMYLSYAWLPLQFKLKRNYRCVFGLGQIGTHIAATIAKASHCPFIYLNDEFPSFWAKCDSLLNPQWAKLEQQAVRNALMMVVPDQQRFLPLCQELSVSPSKTHAVLPNIPIIQSDVEEIDWHKKLNLPEDSIPLLYAGSLFDWAPITELLCSVPYWSEKTVLVLHSQNKIDDARKRLSHLEIPNKVFWSPEPLPVNHLNSLVSYCVGNFALYHNLEPNFEYLGFSAGKLMRSLACGCPVIASNLRSISFVKEYNLGVLINHPVEIPNAIQQILQNREGYKNRCLSFCHSHASFEKYWEKFCEQLRITTKIDLRQPAS